MTRTPTATTTVSVTSSDRDVINRLAEELHLPQRDVVTRLIEAYQGANLNSSSDPPNDALNAITEALDKVIKRDDRVIAFIKEQERVLLNPILQTVQLTDIQLKKLIEILSNLE